MPHLRINAGPGCGKSHTLAHLFMYIRAKNKDYIKKQATEEQMAIYEWAETNLPEECRKKAGYAAYNAEIVEQMVPKSHPECECKTFHGWGYKIINNEYGYVTMNEGRSNYLVSKLTGKAMSQLDNREKWKWLATIAHVEKLKEELMTPTEENLKKIHTKYDNLQSYAYFPDMPDYATKLLAQQKIVEPRVGIEYVDQIWLACFIAKKPILPLGLIDEDQDLSPARLLLARLLFENLVFCGDENQAINAYAGADIHSIDKIREIVALELPLKQSFRCPRHICNKVNAIIPKAQLRPLPERPDEGVEKRVEFNKLGPLLLKYNDEGAMPDEAFNKEYNLQQGLNHWGQVLILSRFNSHLIKCALHLNKHEVPCYIRGNTIIDSLIKIVKNRNASCMEELSQKLDQWLSICTRNAPDMIANMLQDKVDCIKLVMEECDYPDDVPTALKKFLKPKKSKGFVKLSSIHGAKGIEAKHVFILFPPVEHPKATTEDEILQEKHTHLVAVSRSALNLTWVVPTDE